MADPEDRSRSLCQSCVFQLHPIMLTGYCMNGTGMKCDECGRVADLALTVMRLPILKKER